MSKHSSFLFFDQTKLFSCYNAIFQPVAVEFAILVFVIEGDEDRWDLGIHPLFNDLILLLVECHFLDPLIIG